MQNISEYRNYHIGIVALQATGLADRGIGLDILHALSLKAGLQISFNMDCSFDEVEDIWKAIEQTIHLDLLAISLRASAGKLLGRLQKALDNRISHGLTCPLLVFGGPTAMAAPDIIRNLFPTSLIFTSSVESAFPKILSAIKHRNSSNFDPVPFEINEVACFDIIDRPSQFSTERAVNAGGTIWVEASRGCHLNCSFCVLSNNKVSSTWTPRNIESLFDEIQFISKNFGINNFSFSDMSAFETEEFFNKFISEYKKRKCNFTFRCDIRMDSLRKLQHKIVDLQKVGFRQVYVGIESLVPKQQMIYKKKIHDISTLAYLQSLGIVVTIGFIIVDPLMSPVDFRQQVIGVYDQGILGFMATPLKAMRVQRGTVFEQLCREKGLIDKLGDDLYSYSYRCADHLVDMAMQTINFFQESTKVVYYNIYMENMLRLSSKDEDRELVNFLHEITFTFKNTEYAFLDRISRATVEHNNIDGALPEILDAAYWFSSKRKDMFARISKDYEYLLKKGVQYYKNDMEKFIAIHNKVPIFDENLIVLP